MHRRMVVIRSHEWLGAAFSARNFAAAAKPLEQTIAVKGMQFDAGYHPVRVVGRLGVPAELPAAVGFNYGDVRPLQSYCVRADFDDEEAVARMRHDRQAEVVGIYADPQVMLFPAPYCGRPAVGAAEDVARKLGVAALARAGLTGRKVRVAVVDTGIDGSRVPVDGGWAPDPGYVPGSTGPDHGTMCAFDVRIAAPNARILDYALLRSTGGTWNAFLSDAVAAFADLMNRIAAEPGPLVVNNSWGLFDRSQDAPIGSPENYAANLDHPFNQIVGSLVASGADVFFAAGNCGDPCPDGRCGAGDSGPGASIHGANSHPDAITVAAVTVTGRRLGYSSQGPGALYRRKPDLASYSHFRGSGVYDADSGTSAACPVAAGVAAALRQKLSPARYPPARLKGLLQRTARDLGGAGWDYDFGYGVADAAAALRLLGKSKRPTPVRRKAARR